MSLCINPNCTKPSNPDQFRYCQACGSELVLSGKYRVRQLLSDKGGFGKTYEVGDGQTLKVLKVLTNNHPHAVKLFQQEAKVLCQLRQPGIPRGEGYFTYFPRDSTTPVHCLLMEKIAGVDLEEYQKQHRYRPLEQALALDWLMQLASILHEVHHRHFFHRDIKPSNIILKPDGQLVLIDFGAVRQITQTILVGGQNTQLYTSGYAPPEQERGYAVQQSDFFALGRTFVYLLTGKEPNDSAIYDYQNNTLNWRKFASHIDESLAEFIDALMAEKVSQRPENTSLILQQLKQLKQELYPARTLACIPRYFTLQKSPHSSALAVSPYAGFWLRLKASIFDNITVASIAVLLNYLMILKLSKIDWWGSLYIDRLLDQDLLLYCSLFAGLGTTVIGYLAPILLLYYLYIWGLGDFLWVALLISFQLGFLIKWLYFVGLESSILQATLGKLIFKMIVIDREGKRISFQQANRRYWSKLLSTLTLYLGFMLAGWTKRKRALHDMIAGTLVIKK